MVSHPAIGDNARMTDVRRPPLFLLLPGLLLIGFGIGYLASSGNDAPPRPPATPLEGVNLVRLETPRPVSGFRLKRHDGQPFTPASFRGHWNVLFFGYTHCPDVCPLALQTLRLAWRQLAVNPQDPARPRAWIVSVDPDRDSLALLEQYVTYFHADFTGVTGPADEIDKLTRQLGIVYGFEDREGDGYTVNHSAHLVFIDPQGRMAAVLNPPYDADAVIRSLRHLETLP